MPVRIIRIALIIALSSHCYFSQQAEEENDSTSVKPTSSFLKNAIESLKLSATLRFRYLINDPYTNQTENYFYFQRGYLTLEGKFSEKIRSRFTIDFDNENRIGLANLTGKTINANDGTRVRIKYAYIEFIDFLGFTGIDAIFGNYEQPGPQSYHNTIENSWLDRYYEFGYSSAVTGAMLTYNLPQKWGYVRTAVANMNSYSYARDNNDAKNFISDIWIIPPGTGFSFFGWTMLDYYLADNNRTHNTVWGAGAEYAISKKLDVGTELDFIHNTKTGADGNSYMCYVNYYINPELLLVGQAGRMDNNKATIDDEIVMLICGINYKIIGNTYFMVNVINERLKIEGEAKINLRYNFQLLFNL
ncbi:MAG: hypothetical protein C0412_18060 [Flavobacterium sp.]|nr:hypothetical protein [Flavobacterium sp.]